MVTRHFTLGVNHGARRAGRTVTCLDIAGLGRRSRLDRGILGIVGVTVSSARQAGPTGTALPERRDTASASSH